MSCNSIVLVKQVPDTANLSGEVMRPDGTVNRAKLPAIFNPEDKVALELALQVRDQQGGRVTAITMGPPKAAALLRECLYLGADEVHLISDRAFAAADTLATSYVLCAAIKKLGSFDCIFAGRQAIDGDTAQVGPQTAEKLGIPQITYTEQILELHSDQIVVKRRIDGGYEVLKSSLPVLLTVIKDAAEPRPFSAKRLMAFKHARSRAELEQLVKADSSLDLAALEADHIKRKRFIPTMSCDDLDVDRERCGLKGSPTKVKQVASVVLSGGGHQTVEPTKDGMAELIDRLNEDRVFG
jgi:electron transfer flavoprotein beta subunit